MVCQSASRWEVQCIQVRVVVAHKVRKAVRDCHGDLAKFTSLVSEPQHEQHSQFYGSASQTVSWERDHRVCITLVTPRMSTWHATANRNVACAGGRDSCKWSCLKPRLPACLVQAMHASDGSAACQACWHQGRGRHHRLVPHPRLLLHLPANCSGPLCITRRAGIRVLPRAEEAQHYLHRSEAKMTSIQNWPGCWGRGRKLVWCSCVCVCSALEGTHLSSSCHKGKTDR